MVVKKGLHVYDVGEVIEMSFNENLRALRKQKGMSQEQLAEQLNVSRQAVSKWESSDTSYPEMESLIILSELFECSIDDLLKSDLSNYNPTSKQAYEKHYNLMAKAYTFGVTSILLGVSSYPFLEIYFPENTKSEFIPQIILLFFVLVGVIGLVYFGMIDSHFKDKKLELSDFYSEMERSDFNHKYSLSVAIGVGLILFGVVVQMVIESMYSEGLANTLFLLLVTSAVAIFIYYGTLKSKYDKVDENQIIKEAQNKVPAMWCGIIMMVTTAIYLGWSFTTNAWQISWIVFPIGGIICGIFWLIFTMHDKD